MVVSAPAEREPCTVPAAPPSDSISATLTVAASDDAEATEAVVESFELGEAPAKRKG